MWWLVTAAIKTLVKAVTASALQVRHLVNVGLAYHGNQLERGRCCRWSLWIPVRQVIELTDIERMGGACPLFRSFKVAKSFHTSVILPGEPCMMHNTGIISPSVEMRKLRT